MLLILAVEVADRDCDICRKYKHDKQTGELKLHVVTKEPLPRGRGEALACETPQGCPMGTPDRRRALTRRGWLTYNHYMECKATGQFPDDGIVRRNAATIRAAEEAAERILQCRQIRLLEAQTKAVRALMPPT